ncbi:type II toxin-antitoxin system RelE/ParE family toxin [Zwartia sp.]|uniref:type II toxin-antitoxin system RelE family toxin n=1 Tax=Zwartia sp. TaxID=2978004 RepID=UPI00271AA427|nr:type II toxin-antitoxin system RelE/ParE family toxin [Zwartia sp.]MDO9023073.1 type II toxin-antitoxin system RelE/ParE family toxin [Zwartia sp.]
MTFELAFCKDALKEWKKLDNSIKSQFKSKLSERLEHPRVTSAKLSGHSNRYKIKLRNSGYRLVYEVVDKKLIVVVVAIGRREHNLTYVVAAGRQIKEAD